MFFFCVFPTQSVWHLFPVSAFSLICFLFFHSVRAILLSVALVRATPALVKCVVRRPVKVIHRCVREHTIDKTIHTFKYIYHRFPLMFACLLMRTCKMIHGSTLNKLINLLVSQAMHRQLLTPGNQDDSDCIIRINKCTGLTAFHNHVDYKQIVVVLLKI